MRPVMHKRAGDGVGLDEVCHGSLFHKYWSDLADAVHDAHDDLLQVGVGGEALRSNDGEEEQASVDVILG